MRHRFLLTCILHLGGAGSLAAQQQTAGFIRWEPPAISTTPTQRRGDSEPLGDYRYEGLAVGGLSLGALGAWVGSQITAGCTLEAGARCETDRVGQAIGLGLIGAAVGGGVGYLVGRLSPKRPSPLVPDTELPTPNLTSLPDSVREVTGHQHWRGAAIGLAIGGAAGALLGATAGYGCNDCSDQPTRGGQALSVGLIGAGGGGVLGFLAGLASPRYVWIPRSAQ
jgi:hypothetical protein